MQKFKRPSETRILFLTQNKRYDECIKVLMERGNVVVVRCGLDMLREVEKNLPDIILASRDFGSLSSVRSYPRGWEVPIVLLSARELERRSFSATDKIKDSVSPSRLMNKVSYWLETDA